ncbi:uncharacterized protein BO80DRAFT_492029 [Aspergillus ibericus CBS 121593]|uniref:GPI anchored protein n=1 Tax=Aspergillus ibericus CBS 121593 TaxID=1448316 RepID=A0A395H6Y1_9EURO|nr:hypothetical protein BO80DRAFT_492029 [Aspergillus ibericus CBS 121593]RAL03309.1 hypothetical protein BO80DRAFT_492029 [Aspergillus ibericus CBS 121593]
MGHLLVRGWILAALLLQTSVALTVLAQSQTVQCCLSLVRSFFQRNCYSIEYRGALLKRNPFILDSAAKRILHSFFKTRPESFAGFPAALELCLPASATAYPVLGFFLTTSTVLSTRTATITACPSTIPNCLASSKTTYVTTETIVAASATKTAAISPSVTGIAVGHDHGNGGSEYTTSTVFSTRTATITASKTTYLTTETLVVSTTVCPVADATGSSGPAVTQHASSPSLTTSTIFTTRTTTITACPSSVTNCPLRSKTTYATTETLVLGTTVYPVSIAPTNTPLSSATGAGGEVPSVTTSTILSTRFPTVSACGDDANCSALSQGSYVTTEILVTTIPAEGVDTVSASTTIANAQPISSGGASQVVSTGSQSGSAGSGTSSGVGSDANTSAGSGTGAYTASSSGSVSGSSSSSGSSSTSGSTSNIGPNTGANANAVYTTTVTTDIAQPTVAPSAYTLTPHSGSGASGNLNASSSASPSASASASLGHVWPQSSHVSGIRTAVASPTRSAVNPLYTAAASAGSRWSVWQVMGTVLAIMVAMVV